MKILCWLGFHKWLNSRSTSELNRVGWVHFIRTCQRCGKVIPNGSRRGR
jgi:hypothetical protein